VNELFEKLAENLDNEAERQETLLAVCRAQLEALNSRNLAAIEARTAALDILVRETAQAVAARAGLITAVAKELELRPEHRTLSGLISVAPAPWNDRLKLVQDRLQRVLKDCRRVVRMNAHTLRRSLDLNQRLLECIALGPNPDPGYNPRGVFTAISDAPAMIDQRG